MAQSSLFDNTLKVYVDMLGQITKQEDSSFFVSNSNQTNSVTLHILREMDVNMATVSFKRADGFVISNRIMEFIGLDELNTEYNYFEYTFTEDDKILAIGGSLEISFNLKKYDFEQEKITKNYPTTIITAYVRRNIDTQVDITTAEAIYQQIENLTSQWLAQLNETIVNIDYLEEHSNQLTSDVNDIKNKVLSLENQVYALQEITQNHNNKISALETKTTNLENEINTTKTDLIGKKTDGIIADTINGAKNYAENLFKQASNDINIQTFKTVINETDFLEYATIEKINTNLHIRFGNSVKPCNNVDFFISWDGWLSDYLTNIDTIVVDFYDHENGGWQAINSNVYFYGKYSPDTPYYTGRLELNGYCVNIYDLERQIERINTGNYVLDIDAATNNLLPSDENFIDFNPSGENGFDNINICIAVRTNDCYEINISKSGFEI